METDTEKYQSTTMSTDDVVITGIDEDIMSSGELKYQQDESTTNYFNQLS